MVQDSWSVAHAATATRKESYAVSAHKSPGSGHEGEMSAGLVDTVMLEKTIARC